MEPSLYQSIIDIVEAMNKLIQERHNHIETPITAKMYRRTQEVEIHLVNEGSGLALLWKKVTILDALVAMTSEYC